MQTSYNTQRLSLSGLTLADSPFILELLNTEGWIRFIGERYVSTYENAVSYVQGILENTAARYWVVRLHDRQVPIGIITFIRREYFYNHDLGFAFLPQYAKQGYAYEAAHLVLHDLARLKAHRKILATTVEDNENSIRLLEKLGFIFDKKITVSDEALLLYSFDADRLGINDGSQQA